VVNDASLTTVQNSSVVIDASLRRSVDDEWVFQACPDAGDVTDVSQLLCYIFSYFFSHLLVTDVFTYRPLQCNLILFSETSSINFRHHDDDDDVHIPANALFEYFD